MRGPRAPTRSIPPGAFNEQQRFARTGCRWHRRLDAAIEAARWAAGEAVHSLMSGFRSKPRSRRTSDSGRRGVGGGAFFVYRHDPHPNQDLRCRFWSRQRLNEFAGLAEFGPRCVTVHVAKPTMVHSNRIAESASPHAKAQPRGCQRPWTVAGPWLDLPESQYGDPADGRQETPARCRPDRSPPHETRALCGMPSDFSKGRVHQCSSSW